MVEQIKMISEEIKNLKLNVDQLKTQIRSNNLVIHGIPESSFAEATSASVESDSGPTHKSPSRLG